MSFEFMLVLGLLAIAFSLAYVGKQLQRINENVVIVKDAVVTMQTAFRTVQSVAAPLGSSAINTAISTVGAAQHLTTSVWNRVRQATISN